MLASGIDCLIKQCKALLLSLVELAESQLLALVEINFESQVFFAKKASQEIDSMQVSGYIESLVLEFSEIAVELQPENFGLKGVLLFIELLHQQFKIFQMNAQLLIDLNALEKAQYHQDLLLPFLANYDSAQLYNFFTTTKNSKFKKKVSELLKRPEVTFEYILKFIIELARTDNPANYNQVLAEDNELEIYEFFRKHQAAIRPIIANSPFMGNFLLHLLGQQDGLIVLKLALNLFSSDGLYNFPTLPTTLKILQEGLSKRSSARLRFMQLIVTAGMAGRLACYFEAGLIQKALKIYDTDDILQKLASVQIIEKLGGSMQTATLLKNSCIWPLIQKDAFNKELPFFVQKNLICLIIRLAAKGTMKYDFFVGKKVSNFLVENFNQGPQEFIGCIVVVSFLFQFNEGIQSIINDKLIMECLAKAAHLGTSQEKRSCFSALANLTSKEFPKVDRFIINILSSIGQPGIIGGFDMKNGVNDYGISKFVDLLFKNLMNPFEEIERQCAVVLRNMMGWKRLTQEVTMNQKSIQYLTKKKAISIEIFQLKQEVIRHFELSEQFGSFGKLLSEGVKQSNKILKYGLSSQ